MPSPVLSEEAGVPKDNTPKNTPQNAMKSTDAWKPLFDGKTLQGWAVPVFGGDGDVTVKDGCLVLGRGEMMTGVKYEGEFPKLDYEIRYEAQRSDGYDFFAALTFPYKDESCTFINGGWGGGAVGLSSVDNEDASENETAGFHAFQDNIWYKFRLRVTAAKIEVWVDEPTKEGKRKETQLVDLEVGDKKISHRDETSLYRPLGISTWNTEGRVRHVEYRRLKPKPSK